MAEKANRSREQNFSMRIREDHLILMNALCKSRGMNQSVLLRHIITSCPANERPQFTSLFASNLISEINHIGKHVNEVAHMVNGRLFVTKEDAEILGNNYIALFRTYEKYVSYIGDFNIYR